MQLKELNARRRLLARMRNQKPPWWRVQQVNVAIKEMKAKHELAQTNAASLLKRFEPLRNQGIKAFVPTLREQMQLISLPSLLVRMKGTASYLTVRARSSRARAQ